MKFQNTANRGRVLIANSDKLTQRSLYELLCRDEYKADMAGSVKEAIEHIADNIYDVILTDINDKGCLELIQTAKRKAGHSRVIILTTYGNIEAAVVSMKMGVYDYLVMPVEDEIILSSIERAVMEAEGERISLRAQGANSGRDDDISGKERSYHGIVGKSRAMQEIYTIIERISNSKATVLLRGESGTGKRMIAHAIHKADKARKTKPFIEISCGALPRDIIESELFGHAKGSFTGAVSDRKGRFEIADGGTMLLDDIDCLPLDLQVKLLRVLQHKEFERVGESKTVKVDVRIIVATNHDLEKAVDEKRFREDLYYRLNVISINIPPLRGRREDVLLLADYFVNMYSKANNKEIEGISKDTAAILTEYHWPGNIRQLENIIERAVILDTDGLIGKDDLPEIILTRKETVEGVVRASSAMGGIIPLRDALEEPEKVYILRALEEVDWNKKKAANKLGVNRTTLYNKLRKYNIEIPAEKIKS